MSSRAERTAIGEWLWTIDRWLLSGVGLLMIFGIVLLLAGSPAVAESHHLSTFHFVNRQAQFLALSVGVMLIASSLSPRMVRRVSLVLFIVAFAGAILDDVL